jgi:hypothetical protein
MSHCRPYLSTNVRKLGLALNWDALRRSATLTDTYGRYDPIKRRSATTVRRLTSLRDVDDDKLDFCGYAHFMIDVDVKKLLNPLGPAVQEAVKGARNEGRVAVAVHWTEIEAALDAGLTIAAIYRVLSKAGLVGVTVRSFTRQVQARREGARGLGLAAKPATEPRPLAAIAATGGPLFQEASAPTAPDSAGLAEKRPGIPDRPWRKGPRVPPDPNAVFRPRDPLADEN